MEREVRGARGVFDRCLLVCVCLWRGVFDSGLAGAGEFGYKASVCLSIAYLYVCLSVYLCGYRINCIAPYYLILSPQFPTARPFLRHQTRSVSFQIFSALSPSPSSQRSSCIPSSHHLIPTHHQLEKKNDTCQSMP